MNPNLLLPLPDKDGPTNIRAHAEFDNSPGTHLDDIVVFWDTSSQKGEFGVGLIEVYKIVNGESSMVGNTLVYDDGGSHMFEIPLDTTSIWKVKMYFVFDVPK